MAEPLHLSVGSPLRRSGASRNGRRSSSATGASPAAPLPPWSSDPPFPDAQDALFAETNRRGLRMVSGRGIQTVGPKAAEPLMTSEDDAIRLARDEIDKWHAADTGDAKTARLHVAVVPRFSLAVTSETLKSLGELYDSVRDRGVYFHTHLNENDRPGTGEVADNQAGLSGRLLPGHLRRQVSAGLEGRRNKHARAARHHGARGALPRRGAGADVGDGHVHRALPRLSTVPRLGHHAMAPDGCFRGKHRCRNGFRRRRRMADTEVLNAAFKVHIGEPGDAGFRCIRRSCCSSERSAARGHSTWRTASATSTSARRPTSSSSTRTARRHSSR